ncbi:NF-kappa-B inhibitor epsilon [Discoglossus pictus]
MSEEWDEKKLGLHPEEGRYDSGIADSVQLLSLSEDGISQLPSLPEDGDPRSKGPGHQEPNITGDKVSEAQELERIDSSYGSSSLIEPIIESGLCLASTQQRPPESLNPKEVDALTYLSEEGDTLLHLAVIHSVPEVALYFINLVAKDVLDFQNDLYQSALHLAVYLDQVEVVHALVCKGVNLELQDRKGDTALHVACENQNVACARILLQGPNGPQNLQLQNWKGLTCLHVATLMSNKSLVSLLLEGGADINVQEGTSGKTPLHLAVEMLDQPLLTHLLHYRPQVDALMYNGCTPLHLAVGRKDAGLARILCQAGADTLRRNREGDTPQDLAEGNNQLLALLPFDDLKISGKPVVTSA